MRLQKLNERDRMRRIDAFESSFGWKVRATVALVLILGMHARTPSVSFYVERPRKVGAFVIGADQA